jgi:LysM repeat protein
MKKLSIFLTAALVLGLGLFIGWHHSVERAAIQQVLNERVKARDVLHGDQLFYVVEPGDTPPKIARQLGVSVNEVRKLDHLAPFQMIRVGDKLMNPQAVKTAFTDYITELGEIDPSTCPKQFREAWQDYVDSWELKKDPIIQEQNQLDISPTKIKRNLNVNVTQLSMGFGSDVETPNLHSAAERLGKLDNDEAWLKCKRVALNFGVFTE